MTGLRPRSPCEQMPCPNRPYSMSSSCSVAVALAGASTTYATLERNKLAMHDDTWWCAVDVGSFMKSQAVRRSGHQQHNSLPTRFCCICTKLSTEPESMAWLRHCPCQLQLLHCFARCLLNFLPLFRDASGGCEEVREARDLVRKEAGPSRSSCNSIPSMSLL